MAYKLYATDTKDSEAPRSSKKAKIGSRKSQIHTEPLTAPVLSASNPRPEDDSVSSSSPMGELLDPVIPFLTRGGVDKIARGEDSVLGTPLVSDEEGHDASPTTGKDGPDETLGTSAPQQKNRWSPRSGDGGTIRVVVRGTKGRAIAADPNQGRCFLTMKTCAEHQAGELVEAVHVMTRSTSHHHVSLCMLMTASFSERPSLIAGDPMRRLELGQAG
jgi:hypothetical protein